MRESFPPGERGGVDLSTPYISLRVHGSEEEMSQPGGVGGGVGEGVGGQHAETLG